MSSEVEEESLQGEDQEMIGQQEDEGVEKSLQDIENGNSTPEDIQDDDDEDYEAAGKKKKKTSKKRKSKAGESGKKEKKKKKKSKSKDFDENEDEFDEVLPAPPPLVEEEESVKRSRRNRTSKISNAVEQSAPKETLPTVSEVCESFLLKDVNIQYTDVDFHNLMTYKQYAAQIRPLIQKENPKVPLAKLMMLVAAKWRDFCTANPNLQENVEEEREKSKPSSSINSSHRDDEKDFEVDYNDEDEEIDCKNNKNTSGGGRKSARSTKGKSGKVSSTNNKSKVPTLKIKIGKRKRGTSDDDVSISDKDSDKEFEQMLKEAE